MSKSRFSHLFRSKASEDNEDKKEHQAVEDDEDKKDDEAEDEEEKSKAEEKEDEKEDDEKAEEEETPEAKKARKAENKRCSSIFASQHASHNTGMAAHLAFETRMSAKDAIGVLKMSSQSAGQKYKATTLDDRMRSVGNPQVGSDSVANKEQTVASKMIDTYLSVKGKK